MDLLSKILFCWICLQVIFATVFSDVWKAQVVTPMKALVSSCVVVPCKFNYPGSELPDSRLKGIWHKASNMAERIYDEDSKIVLDSFKHRTRLIGLLRDKNCTLEIDNVKDHDNGPFCFRTEIPTIDKFSFVDNCVTINMEYKPEKPSLDHEDFFIEGTIAVFKCYVRHTCPTHHPTIQWSRPDAESRLSYKDNGHGVWEVESLLTFTAKEEDDHMELTCTVTFHGNQKSEVTRKIFIKRKTNFLHIIIPMAAVLGTILLFGAACFFVTKRYRRQIEELQSRNPNGLWSRLSRMSHRIHGRRQEPGRFDNTMTDNYVSTISGTKGVSKPRFPSPKSEIKFYNKSTGGCSADYGDDLNIYGNV